MTRLDVSHLAQEMIDALDEARLVEQATQRFPGLDFETAYRVARECTSLRRARGERPVGRKIGYTNRSIWDRYNVHQPIWDHVYAHTVQYTESMATTQSVARMISPLIESEIAFRLRAPIPAGCDDPEVVLRSVDQVARTFEIVDCHYENWQFAGPDSVIDFSHHAALIVGEPRKITEREIPGLAKALAYCRVTLLLEGTVVANGVGANALDHPALALGLLADVVASQPDADPLGEGEIITTGTLTAPMPVEPGQTWTTDTDGLDLPPLSVRFE